MRIAALAVGAMLLLGAAGGAAQPRTPSASERALGRTEFNEGMRAVREERWDDACAHFARAYELTQRAGVLVNLASAEMERGRLLQAAEHFREFLRNAEEARGATRERVEELLAELEPRIPRAEIAVRGLAAGDRVLLDGVEINRAAIGAPLPVDPGEHELTVERYGAVVARESFAAAEGEEPSVSIEVAPPVRRAAAGVDSEEERPPGLRPVRARGDEEDEEDEGGSVLSSPWFWLVSAVVIGAGVAAAVIFLPGEEPASQGWEGTIPPGHWDVR